MANATAVDEKRCTHGMKDGNPRTCGQCHDEFEAAFNDNLNNFPELVKMQLDLARALYPRPINSLHEAFGILYEEFYEYQEQVMKRETSRDYENIVSELAQISAVCQRIAEDLKLGNRICRS